MAQGGLPLRGMPLEGGQCKAECYAHVRTVPNQNALDLIYCFFYPYNGATGLSGWLPKVGTHIGDWEHVTVRITNNDSPEIIGVYFARHGLHEPWRLPRECSFSGSHVIVYSALSSHASYPDPGAHEAKAWVFALDYTEQGPPWRTWESVVDVGELCDGQSPAPGCEWLRFTGLWGNTKYGWTWSDGPRTPSFQGWFNEGDPGLGPLWQGGQAIVISGQEVKTKRSAAAAVYGDKLYVVYPDSSDHVRCAWFDGSSWFGNQVIKVGNNEVATQGASVGLAAVKNELFLTYTGAKEDHILWAISDGDTWSENTVLNICGVTPYTATVPALQAYKDRLYMGYRGHSEPHLLWASFNGTSWAGDQGIYVPDHHPATSLWPALFVYKDALTMMCHGADHDYVYWANATGPDFPGCMWLGDERIQMSGNYAESAAVPAIASFGDRLYMVYREAGTGDRLRWAYNE